MKITIAKADLENIHQETLVAFYFENKATASINSLKQASASVIDTLIEKKRLSSNLGKTTTILSHPDLNTDHVLIVGCGKAENFDEAALIKVIKCVVSELKNANSESAVVPLDDLLISTRNAEWVTQKASEILFTSLYQYDTTKSKKNDPATLKELVFASDSEGLDAQVTTGKGIAHGMNVARELGNLPANVCDPDYLEEQAAQLADAYDEIDIEVINEEQMAEFGMGAFLAVSRASAKQGRIIILKYSGADKNEAPHVLVGKGLTFDSGGISIKPAGGMEEMKWDMLGAASVFGTMNTLGELKPSINVIGVIAAAENMVSGDATRPGDVVTTMNGKTVEIINTDAEGRLVLCDALTYVERFDPASVVDIATLTGAVIVGLGHHPTAVYANDEELQQQLLAAGKESWDRGWPMPLWPEYKEDLKSPYADLRNVGSRAGGSITAAIYLSEFTESYRWAHLDIAGTGWKSAKEGASGRPVGMLVQYLLNRISSN